MDFFRSVPGEARDVAAAQPEIVRRIAEIIAREHSPYKLKKYNNALTI